MSKRAQRYGSLAILFFMLSLALFTAGCIVTTNINIGHHQKIDKDVDARDVLLDQEYDIKAGGNRR